MTRTFPPVSRDEKGVALVAIIMMLGAVTILSIGLILFSSTEVQVAHNYQTHTGALYVAEAGISEAMARMNLQPETEIHVNGHKFDASIGDDPLNLDPDWRTEIHLARESQLPAPQGNELVVATIQPSSSWLNYGDAEAGLPPIVIEHKWLDRNGDGVRDPHEIVLYDENRYPPENFESGNPVEVVVSSGFFNGAKRTIRADVARAPLSARLSAPVTADYDIDLGSSSDVSICGHNHDPLMPPDTKIPQCYPWELCNDRTRDGAAGCLFGLTTTGDRIKVTKKTGRHITQGDPPNSKKKHLVTHGYPTWADTSSYNVFYDIHDALGLMEAEWDSIKATADWTEEKLEKENGWRGLWVREGVKGHREEKAELKETSGSGLIYVDGQFKMKKSTWVGLIYAEGKVDIGTRSWVIGGVIARGEKKDGKRDKSKIKKKSGVSYSAQAIAHALDRRRPFKVIAWKEL